MRVLQAIIILLLVLPALVPAQVISAGATPDEVMRALGAPRARSAAKGREIWLYPVHQAVFENGRLVSLVALPADGGNVTWKKGAVTPESPSPELPVASGANRTRSGELFPDPKEKSGAMIVKREGGKIILRSPERSAPPPPVKETRGGFVSVFVSLGLLLLLGAGGVLVWLRRRKRAAELKAAAEKQAAEQAAKVQPKPEVTAGTRGSPFSPELKPPSLADWELTPELLRTMEWKRFELLVQRYFAASGLKAKTHLVGADGGVELYLYRGRSTRPHCYVRCRTWGNVNVDGPQVREFFSQMVESRVSEGMIITTGSFLPETELFARQNRISLLTSADLIRRFNRLSPMVRARILTDVTDGDFTTPSCPRCNLKLVIRERSPEGASTWGCRRFPSCRYVITSPVESGAVVAAP